MKITLDIPDNILTVIANRRGWSDTGKLTLEDAIASVIYENIKQEYVSFMVLASQDIARKQGIDQATLDIAPFSDKIVPIDSTKVGG